MLTEGAVVPMKDENTVSAPVLNIFFLFICFLNFSVFFLVEDKLRKFSKKYMQPVLREFANKEWIY